MYKVSRILQSLSELVIHRSMEKRKESNISDMTVNNLKISIVLEIVLVLIYRMISSYKCKLQVWKTRVCRWKI